MTVSLHDIPRANGIFDHDREWLAERFLAVEAKDAA